MIYGKLASAIYNNVFDALRGYHQTMNISMDQLEQDVVDERLQIIKEYILRGIIPKKELLMSINCIPVDCIPIDRCPCDRGLDDCDSDEVAHFEIPQVMLDFGNEAIEYIGTTDRMFPFIIYTSSKLLRYNRTRKRNRKKPFVFIDYTPNTNNKNDGFIFNAPLIKMITAVIIPKDPRQLEDYDCCTTEDVDNMTFINAEIKKRLTEKYIRYYRQL
jgi:hypothetical protein